MNEFEDILDELALVDVKTSDGWFMWSNNREGANLVKERLDGFLVSEDLIEKLPFITTKVVCQLKSDHEAIFLNTQDCQSGEIGRDYRSCFKLESKIGKIMDGPNNERSSNLLKVARDQLSHLYDMEESYLNSEFTDDEIMTAFKHMDPRKALGIHRLLGSFFKEHWSTVGSDVLRMCQDVLQGNKMWTVLMILYWNQHSEVETFIRILDNFPRMSDQSINLEKSMVYFSPNTPVTQRATINGWSKHLLSNGGNEIFIKSVIQAIPTYTFLVFMAPKGVLEEIQSMTSHVWWGGGEKKRGSNMLPWDRLCYPKGMDSLGFWDLQLFNIALFGR
ncbi:hypothetical protein PVK06_005561 [Gossypium arboreum]|uniref:Reverse transcriptase n=1 Tax=Gossypium arboreum TaxID=29729 RepID=A0ABR0QW72_GOSAR|nr:hypothetical protein PVK06_005561 [Gossypium arboreum]